MILCNYNCTTLLSPALLERLVRRPAETSSFLVLALEDTIKPLLVAFSPAHIAHLNTMILMDSISPVNFVFSCA